MTSKSKTAKTKTQPASKKPAAKVPAKVAKAVAAKKAAPKALPVKTIAQVKKTATALKTVAKEQAAQGNADTAKILETTAKKFDKVAAKAVLVKPDAKAKAAPVKPKASKAPAPKVTVKKAKTVSLPPSKTTIVPNKSQYKAVTTKKAPAAPANAVTNARTMSVADLTRAMHSAAQQSSQPAAVKPVIEVPSSKLNVPAYGKSISTPAKGTTSVQDVFAKLTNDKAAAARPAPLPDFLRR